AAPGGLPGATPEHHERAIRRKANSARRGVSQFRHAAGREVLHVAGPDLGYPRVPDSITVGEKSDELPVARNGGVVLSSLEIRQHRELRAFQWIPPEVLRALQLPRNGTGNDQQTRRRGPPREST